MNALALAQHRLDLATDLELMPTEDRLRATWSAVIETGGTFVTPQPNRNWGPHQAELTLLGVSHHGNSAAEAVANWIKAVIRMARAAQEAAN